MKLLYQIAAKFLIVYSKFQHLSQHRLIPNCSHLGINPRATRLVASIYKISEQAYLFCAWDTICNQGYSKENIQACEIFGPIKVIFVVLI